MTNPVALLDVDHTLLFDTTLNETLLNSLKKKGIKDVYLFTDMKYGRGNVEDRMKLVQQLEARGFTVHGVITPVDLVWQQFTEEDSIKMDEWTTDGYRGKLYGPTFEAELKKQETESALPFLKKVIEYIPEKNKPGASYADAVKAYQSMPTTAKEDEPLPGHMLARSSYAKVFADRLAQDYDNTKGLLLDFFIRHKPDWVSSIVVMDDREKVISAVKQYVERSKTDVPITTIHVTSDKLEASFYDSQLDEHLKKDPAVVLASLNDKIDVFIATLNKSRFNPFLSSPEAKIAALKILKKELENTLNSGDETRIGDIIDAWKSSQKFTNTRTNETVSVAKVLAQHRNIFRPETREVETSTQLFIESLKRDFADITFNKAQESELQLELQ
ncbi:hypothetical protein [Legionella cardiaca]|uniref:Dot/Icm T4SS effector n=1 Tax=Legionella cardiaca TaxID=1071983 RepID=A0ABY8ASG8_9GAMM|nr:hypothetical protein [Legionella cardiaca]WED42445.1 hypothetical protein PXX05_11030 [Legionella cardiaca]